MYPNREGRGGGRDLFPTPTGGGGRNNLSMAHMVTEVGARSSLAAGPRVSVGKSEFRAFSVSVGSR